MMLVEESTVPDSALPLDAFKAHLRIGTGFGEDGLQDGVLRSFLRAAIAAIEARTGKVLIQREFSVVLGQWQNTHAQALPVAPISVVSSLHLIDHLGTENPVGADTYWLEQDMHRPRLKPKGWMLPQVPQDGTAKVVFVAGYHTTFDGIPADLGQAVLLLAAHYYEFRHETSLTSGAMPFGVASLIERYRSISLRGGHV